MDADAGLACRIGKLRIGGTRLGIDPAIGDEPGGDIGLSPHAVGRCRPFPVRLVEIAGERAAAQEIAEGGAGHHAARPALPAFIRAEPVGRRRHDALERKIAAGNRDQSSGQGKRPVEKRLWFLARRWRFGDRLTRLNPFQLSRSRREGLAEEIGINRSRQASL
jgi:hypothetical protein